MTAQQVFRNTVVVILTVVTAYILFISMNIVIILIFAVIIASALRPIILWFDRHGLSQGLAITVTYVGLLVLIIGLFVIVLPPAVNRLGGYIENDDRLAQKLIDANRWAETSLNNIAHPDVPITLFDEDSIRTSVSRAVASLRRALPELAGDVGGILGEAILVFVIGVYWITSRNQAVDFTLQLFSIGKRAEVTEIITEIEQSLGAYVRGMGLVVLFVGIANFALLALFRVPNAVTLAFIIGITTALPIVGGFIGAGVAVFIALIESPLAALFTLLSFVLVQQVETHYLTPRTMANSVHISPILVIVAIFIGFAVGGVTGALISVPIAGTLMVLARHLVIEPKRSEVTPQRIEGGILIAGKETRLDSAIPSETGTAP